MAGTWSPWECDHFGHRFPSKITRFLPGKKARKVTHPPLGGAAGAWDTHFIVGGLYFTRSVYAVEKLHFNSGSESRSLAMFCVRKIFAIVTVSTRQFFFERDLYY